VSDILAADEVTAGAGTASRVVRDAREYVLFPWKPAGSEEIAISHGSGSWFWDCDGNRYLDFGSQLVNVNLGHGHPRLVAAIKEQADRLAAASSSFANAPRSELARLIAEVTPGDLKSSFFTNGGAEANEHAIRLARLATGRQKVIARYRSYHGATAGAMTLTGDPRRWPAEPGVPGVVRMLDPYTYRCPAGHPEPCPVCTGAPHLEEILQYEGAETVAAVVLETITGINGVIPPPPGYLQSIREVCDRHGVLLVLDEVMVGFGRTGKWFACDHWDVVPDILTCAKGITSGYVPLGAVVVGEPVIDRLGGRPIGSGLTYSGHPLACACAVATIETLADEHVVERAAETGKTLGSGLAALAERHPSIGDVRGLGAFWGVELVRNRETRDPLVPFDARGAAAEPVESLVRAAMRRGLYMLSHWNVLLVCPPLTISEEECEEGLALLDDVLELADACYG